MTARLLAYLLFGALAFPATRTHAADDDGAPLLLAATDEAGLVAAKGKAVVVRGKVTRTGKSTATGVNFLNFGSGDFTVVTYGKNLKAFPEGEPADVYKEKYLEVRGEITFYKDKPQIELASPDQISVIDQKTSDEAIRKAADSANATPDKDANAEKAEAEEGSKPTEVDPRKYFSD